MAAGRDHAGYLLVNIYRFRFSVRTSITSVHSDSCSSAAFYGENKKIIDGMQIGTHRSGDTIWQTRAASAEAAAKAQEDEFEAEERKMPKVKVCECCKGK